MLAVRKTNLKLKISFNPKDISFESVATQLSKLGRQLATICNLYPCPKTYAMFHAFKSRGELTSVNALLDKYWFPTSQVEAYTNG